VAFGFDDFGQFRHILLRDKIPLASSNWKDSKVVSRKRALGSAETTWGRPPLIVAFAPGDPHRRSRMARNWSTVKWSFGVFIDSFA
jgi:hypothetical protein